MSNATCPNCGAALIAGAKFCRQCGRLVSSSANASSVTEATTRTLRTPAEYAAQPTDFFPPQPTSPAYMSPKETPPPPAYDTRSLEQSGRKGNAWLMSAVVAILLCALIAVGIIFFVKSRSSTTQPSTTVPEPPTVTVPGIPPPPPPKPPTTRAGTNAISSELIYPGAKTTLEMESEEGGSMLQLQSKDAYEKVLDWYLEKLKPKNIKRLPGPMAVLNSDKLVAIINGGNGDTSIILKRHDEMDMDMDMDR
jgi:hypothetical protein